MFSRQIQAKRFLKAKIRLPTPHANHKTNELKIQEHKKKIIPLFSHTNAENNTINYMPDFKNLEEAKLPYTETQLSELQTSLSQTFGADLVTKDIPQNLLISEKFFSSTRLPQPFLRYSNNKNIETTGNNAHFTAIGQNYIDFLKEKYTLENINMQKIADVEPNAVLGFLYLTNYNSGKAAQLEASIIDVLKK